jgi:hypothetical protein
VRAQLGQPDRSGGGWTTHPPSRPACAARTSPRNCPLLAPRSRPFRDCRTEAGHRYRGDPAAVVPCPAVRTGNTRYGISACKKWLSTGRTGPPSHSHGEHMPARRRHAEHIQAATVRCGRQATKPQDFPKSVRGTPRPRLLPAPAWPHACQRRE